MLINKIIDKINIFIGFIIDKSLNQLIRLHNKFNLNLNVDYFLYIFVFLSIVLFYAIIILTFNGIFSILK